MYPGLLALLRCSACQAGPLEASSTHLLCRACGAEFQSGSYVDLLNPHLGEPVATTKEQRLMESALVANLYERFWRPAFVRAIAGSGAGARAGGFPGELFIHKNALGMEDRQGPWLDLSCGPGLFARGMAAAAPTSLVVGLDISHAMLEAAARRSRGYSNVALVRGDAHQLPFIDACFGGINNAGALHAYDDPEAAFREVLRVLQPGAVYVGSTFAPAPSAAGRLTARVAGIRRFDPHEMRAQLSRIGFADYDEIRLGDAFVFRVRRP